MQVDLGRAHRIRRSSGDDGACSLLPRKCGHTTMSTMAVERSPTIEEINALETPVDAAGQGGLLASCVALDARWNAGHRDEETARRRAFLYWWACAEPDFLTGLPEGLGTTPFEEMHSWLTSRPDMDPETRFVLGWMLNAFPWCCGASADLERQGQRLLFRHYNDRSGREIAFDEQSEYGRYFGHILNTHPAA